MKTEMRVLTSIRCELSEAGFNSKPRPAVLTSGFHRGLGHTDRKGERAIFSPKAFAGIGPLPHALAERSGFLRVSASPR